MLTSLLLKCKCLVLLWWLRKVYMSRYEGLKAVKFGFIAFIYTHFWQLKSFGRTVLHSVRFL